MSSMYLNCARQFSEEFSAALTICIATSFLAGLSSGVPLAGGVLGGGVPPPPGSVHRCFALPSQVQICSRVPSALLPSVTSRHLPEFALRSPPLWTAHFCAPVPLQSYSWICVPLPRPAAVTSRHLPSARRSSPTVQICAAEELQVLSWTAVPLAVPARST